WCYLEENSHCRFWLAPGLKFYWQVGAAQKSLNGVCGDSYGFLYLPGGRLAAILSDGMGQGEKAYRQSRSVVEMLGEFLQFGFSAQEALRTVNSLLLLRPEQESFATVDLVLLNLYSGEAEFLKIASPPAYLLRGEHVSQLKGNSLPVGIISDVSAAVIIKKMRDRDQVILFTDGLLNKMGEDEWLQAALPELGNLPPNQGAELLLELAEQNWGASDDRTVLILKIKEYR
ncbi:MAG: SpoIIE family protein phosphatase, partial [Clostridia bacterium]|nr:SpoIIE family protein phosphatase [Clostridia bacterium]